MSSSMTDTHLDRECLFLSLHWVYSGYTMRPKGRPLARPVWRRLWPCPCECPWPESKGTHTCQRSSWPPLKKCAPWFVQWRQREVECIKPGVRSSQQTSMDPEEQSLSSSTEKSPSCTCSLSTQQSHRTSVTGHANHLNITDYNQTHELLGVTFRENGLSQMWHIHFHKSKITDDAQSSANNSILKKVKVKLENFSSHLKHFILFFIL